MLRLLLLRGFSLLAGAGVTLVARPGLLFVASLVAEPRPQGMWASVIPQVGSMAAAARL